MSKPTIRELLDNVRDEDRYIDHIDELAERVEAVVYACEGTKGGDYISKDLVLRLLDGLKP